MKLLIIVICLLSERYLVHVTSHARFHWFSDGSSWLFQHVKISSGCWSLVTLTMPITLITWVIYALIENWLFGLIGFVFSTAIFYYCLGPQNPFYPVRTADATDKEDIIHYLLGVNSQVFAVTFWFLVLGPAGAIMYRLCSLAQSNAYTKSCAILVTAYLDWLPTRVTALFYLLVGNFQSGIKDYIKLFLTLPNNNHKLLRICGMEAIGQGHEEPPRLSQAECLVEHALIAFLVIVALMTITARV